LPCVGNDIVDLKDPANAQKSADLRFLKKILADTETERFCGWNNPDTALWSIWACKEAAYKVLKKQTGDAAFVPRRWSVHLRRPSSAAGHENIRHSDVRSGDQNRGAFAAGEVMIPEKNSVPFILFSSLSYVHCVAADCFDVLNKAIWHVDELPCGRDPEDTDSSKFVRKCLIHALSDFLPEESRRIKIVRTFPEGGELQPPAVYLNDVKSGIDISLSHDGRFVAFAFLP